MKASVILAHPYEKSFNHAIFRTVCRSLSELSVEVFAHDLYSEGFNPVLSVSELGKEPSEDPLVRAYADELIESALLVFIHPNWWGQPPAVLKGYIDRVFRPPYAYDMPEGALSGLPIEKLNGKYGLVYNTSNTPPEREENYFGDPLERTWRQCVFGFCGIDKYLRRMFRIVSESTAGVRAEWLATVDDDIKNIVSNTG